MFEYNIYVINIGLWARLSTCGICSDMTSPPLHEGAAGSTSWGRRELWLSGCDSSVQVLPAFAVPECNVSDFGHLEPPDDHEVLRDRDGVADGHEHEVLVTALLGQSDGNIEKLHELLGVVGDSCTHSSAPEESGYVTYTILTCIWCCCKYIG